MKTIMIVILLLFLCNMLIAPNLSVNERNKLDLRLILEFERKKWNDEFDKFANHLGIKESNLNWMVINSIGCIGLYQFSPNTLKSLGYAYINPKTFKANPNIFPPELQHRVLNTLISSNMIELKYHMEYIGKEIKGTVITKAGLLGAAHLGGARAVMLYLESNGAVDRSDMNGTSISSYIKEFSMYNL